jgi:hypothetical protein
MKHHVKTVLRISSSFFQSTPERVLYGLGQGSSRSPLFWIMISIILSVPWSPKWALEYFCTLESQMGIKATYSCLHQHLTTNHTTKSFVDNSTNFINGSQDCEPYTDKQLGHWLTLQNKAWEPILSTSGGKLELPKCLAYIVVYNWNKGELQQQPSSSMTTQIRVQDTKTQQQTTIGIKTLKTATKH